MPFHFRVRFVVLVVLASGSGCLPTRDNHHDPAVRPSIVYDVYTLVPAGAAAHDVEYGGDKYRAVPGDSGNSTTLFLVDARGTTDPDSGADSLRFTWDLGADGDDAFTADPCPGQIDGVPPDPRGACRIIPPSLTSGFARNAPIPLRVRVNDEKGHVDETDIRALLVDVRPRAAAGSDVLLPLAPCLACRPVVLDGGQSMDADPTAEGEALAAYCWEQIAPAATVPVTVFAASPSLECPPSVVAGRATAARAITFLADGHGATNADPVSYRFRLHVKDRYAWSEPDPVEVRIATAPLWAVSLLPPVAQRFSGGHLRFAEEAFQTFEAKPSIADAPAGASSVFVVKGAGQSFAELLHLGPDGFVSQVGTVNAAGNKSAAATDGSVLWAVAQNFFQPYATTFLVKFAVTSTSATLLADDIPAGIDGVPDLVAMAPDGGAWLAQRLGSSLWKVRASASGCGTNPECTVLEHAVANLGEVREIAVGPDGRVYVLDEAAGAVTVVGADGVVEPLPLRELLPDARAIRYDDGGDPADVANDRLWVSDADLGLFAISVTTGEVDLVLDEPDAGLIRIGTDGTLWLLASGASQARRIDARTGDPLGQFSLDGPVTQAGAVTSEGALVVRTPGAGLGGFTVMLLPPSSGLIEGSSPPIGVLRDASTSPEDGGAWLAYDSPPRVVAVRADGAMREATGFESYAIGDAPERLLIKPWRVAADRDTGALWLVDRDAVFLNANYHWLLSERPALGSDAAPVPLAELRDRGPVLRIRPAGDGDQGGARAWAMTKTNFGAPRLERLERNGSTLDVTAIPFSAGGGPIAGPAVDGTGRAWMAQCHPAGAPFDPEAFCNCGEDGDEASCQVGIRLSFADADATSMTPFVPPEDLGDCGGFSSPCAVLPLDIAYDRARNALWLAAHDFKEVGFQTRYRFWRFSCDGLPLETCSSMQVSQIGSILPSSLDYFEIANLHQDRPDLLGIDEGTGRAFFLEPVSGRLYVLQPVEFGGGESLKVVGIVAATGADRMSLGR